MVAINRISLFKFSTVSSTQAVLPRARPERPRVSWNTFEEAVTVTKRIIPAT